MLALMIMMSEPVETQFRPIPTPSQQSDSALPTDWQGGPAAHLPGPDRSVASFDPSAVVYTAPDMCVIVPNQPVPACAQAPQAQQSLTINEDIFNVASSNPDSTCQTIETTRRNADGTPSRVFATYCGEELGRSDYRETPTPTNADSPIRPSQHHIGVD